MRVLVARDAKFALIGGMAVSFRSVERTTKDVDLVVAVESDTEAEHLIGSLLSAGYLIQTVVEQESAEQLSTVRLISDGDTEMLVDLLFASSGIEAEIVAAADHIEIFPDLLVPVASTSSLIALKVLSADPDTRLQDILDLQNLLRDASAGELEESKNLLALITDRGFNRNKDINRARELSLAISFIAGPPFFYFIPFTSASFHAEFLK